MAQVSLAMALDITGQHWEKLESRVMTQVAQQVAQEARKSTAQADTLLDLQELEGRVMPVFCLDYGGMLLRPINSRRWLCTACP